MDPAEKAARWAEENRQTNALAAVMFRVDEQDVLKARRALFGSRQTGRPADPIVRDAARWAHENGETNVAAAERFGRSDSAISITRRRMFPDEIRVREARPSPRNFWRDKYSYTDNMSIFEEPELDDPPHINLAGADHPELPDPTDFHDAP